MATFHTFRNYHQPPIEEADYAAHAYGWTTATSLS